MFVSTLNSIWLRVTFSPHEEPLTLGEHFLFALSILCGMQQCEECIAVHQSGAISYQETASPAPWNGMSV